jgi:hypothetical protein
MRKKEEQFKIAHFHFAEQEERDKQQKRFYTNRVLKSQAGMRSKGVSPGVSPRENLQPLKANLRQQAAKSRGAVFARDGKP